MLSLFALFGLDFFTSAFCFFSSFPVCRLEVIRGRWFTYILRDLVVHFLRIYIVVVVVACVICPAAPPLSLGFCVFLSHRLDRSICCVVFVGPWCVDWIRCSYGIVSFFGTCSFLVLYCAVTVFLVA